MKLTKIVWLLATLSLTASAQVAPPVIVRPIPRPLPPLPQPQPQPQPQPGPGQVDVELTHTGLVDSTFVRAHAPDAILKMAEAVKQGTLPRADLETLAGKKVTAALLTAPHQIIIRPKFLELIGPGTIPPVTIPHPNPLPQQRRMTNWHGVVSQLTHVKLTDLVDYSPSAINFSDVWDKQTVYGEVNITSPTDGPVTAELPANSPFAIAALRVYDGTYRATSPGPFGRLYRVPVAAVTHAPWTIDVNAGQDVQVELVFSPHFDLFSFPAGWYSSTLKIDGKYWNSNDPKEQPWTITVPAKGRFDGLDLNKIGIVMINHGYDGYVVEPPSYYPHDPQLVTIPVTFMNLAAQPLAGNVTSGDLPAGVTMDPLHVSVGPNQTIVQNVTLRIDRSNQQGVWFWAKNTAYPFSLSLAAGPSTHTLGLTMTLLPGFDHWGLHGSCGSVDYSADFMMDSTGFFTFSGNGFNNNLVKGWDVLFRGGFDRDSRDDVNCGVGVDRDSNFGTSYGWHRQSFQNDYQAYLGQMFYLHVETR